MQHIEQLLKKWANLREYGDLGKLADLLGYADHSQVSRILSGDHTPTIDQQLIIKKFYDDREAKRKKLSA